MNEIALGFAFVFVFLAWIIYVIRTSREEASRMTRLADDNAKVKLRKQRTYWKEWSQLHEF